MNSLQSGLMENVSYTAQIVNQMMATACEYKSRRTKNRMERRGTRLSQFSNLALKSEKEMPSEEICERKIIVVKVEIAATRQLSLINDRVYIITHRLNLYVKISQDVKKKT